MVDRGFYANLTSSQHATFYFFQSFLILYNAVFIAGLIWFYMYDKDELVICCTMQLAASACLWVAAAISFNAVKTNLTELKKKSKQTLLLFRIIIHNGLCFYATWAFVIGMTGFSSALIYKNSHGVPKPQLRGIVNVEEGSLIGLQGMLIACLVLFVIDNFVYEDYFRYVHSIYPVFITSFAGIAGSLEMDNTKRNASLAVFGTTFSTILLMVKLVRTGVKLANEDEYEKKNT